MPQELNTQNLSAEKIEILESRPENIGFALDERPEKTPGARAWMFPDAEDKWQEITWREFRDWCHRVAAGLLELGMTKGDKLAIAANTRIEWVIADFANNCIGGITTTIYPNARVNDYAHILSYSQAGFALVENPDTLDVLLEAESMHAKNPGESPLKAIILMSNGTDLLDPRIVTLADVERRGAQRLARDPQCVREAIAEVKPDDLATIIFTSGTTGLPKGVEITHDNWLYQSAAWHTLGLLTEDDVHYLWLPLSHAFGKCLNLISISHGATTAIDGRVDKIFDNLSVVRPTAMCGVPRIFEKVRAAVQTKFPQGGVKQRLSEWAFSVGEKTTPYRLAGKKLPLALRPQAALAEKLVFSKLKKLMGGRLRYFISGSAKLSPEVQRWFYAAGILLVEGYGVTESCAVTFFSKPWEPQFGTVGKLVPGSSCKIAQDGEILVSGPGIMRGYHKDEQRTAEVLHDGWLHTGDIGTIAEDGTLTITDRKKDLIKTSGGKYVSPAEVESTLMAACPYFSQVMVVGEGRKYVSAVVTLDRDALTRWGANHGHEELDYAELTQLPEVKHAVTNYVERANRTLARWETVKKFVILDHELEVATGTVTPTMKVRRQAVMERYREEIDSLYND
ncbi:AMP-dependent synthetase/ligase [Dermabacteraceae bacterium P13088]